MTLTVEDGTGLANADALISVADATTHHSARGNSTWGAADTDDQEAAIRVASSYLMNSFRWCGWPVNGREQAMPFPRTGLTDTYGYSVDSDSVPREIVAACAELAEAERASPGTLNPTYTASERVKSETFGSVSFTYDLSRTDADSIRPVLLEVRDLIGPFLDAGSGNRLSGGVVRG